MSAPKPGARKQKETSPTTPRTTREPRPSAKNNRSAAPLPTASLLAHGRSSGPGDAVGTGLGAARHVEIPEKIKELVRLAQEQGYLTYGDISEALPHNLVTPEELDEICIKLRNLDVEIVDQAEVDRVKRADLEDEEDKNRLDILDDPVRMYLKQMGQVPLLTREQEVEISKRIERAENEVKRIIYSMGFAAKEHIALAEKLVSEPPKERFDRVILDKKIDGRDGHLRALHRLMKQVRALDRTVDERYAAWRNGPPRPKRSRLGNAVKKLDQKLRRFFDRFFYKQKVIEEMALVAENIHDKIQLSLPEHRRSATPAKVSLAARRPGVRRAQDQGAGGFCPHALPGVPRRLSDS